MSILTEGNAKFHASVAPVVSKDMEIFYNPVMKLNRDITLLMLRTWEREKLRVAEPLAGSGVRGLRMLLELPMNKIAEAVMNDADPKAAAAIRKNLALNRLRSKKVTVENNDANRFLLSSPGFDYIDIDPFGTPVHFLESTLRKVSRKGMVAVTATDTAALAGTSPKACLRKYWAVPLRNELMHEIGLRILIRRVQLVAASQGKAALPLLSYFRDHYYRAFIMVEKGRKKADEVLKQHRPFSYCTVCMERTAAAVQQCSSCKGKNVLTAGPLWTGKLWDASRAKKLAAAAEGDAKQLLETIAREAAIPALGFYDVHVLCRKLKRSTVPKMTAVLSALRRKGKNASTTHFSPTGLRTDATAKEMLTAVKRA